LLRRRARKRASANERKALKKFEAITEKSIPELKLRQKSRHSTKIKRQANLGLEGILREGRGLWHLAFPYQKNVVFKSSFLKLLNYEIKSGHAFTSLYF